MSGHGAKLPRRQEAAIAALVECPTRAEAATKAGVSEATLGRWLQLDEFREAYRTARRQLVESAIGHLQRAAEDAVEALKRNLKSGTPAAEVSAARTILSQAVQAVELIDIAERIEALETFVENKVNDRKTR